VLRLLSEKWKALVEVQLIEVRVPQESGATALIDIFVKLLCFLWQNILDD